MLGKLHDTQNWKAPVADGIKNFWWKYLKCTYKVIEQFFHQNVQAPSANILMPRFPTVGVICMLPKSGPAL
jgi:hypothetical protein